MKCIVMRSKLFNRFGENKFACL